MKNFLFSRGKRFLALFLALVLVFGLLGGGAFAFVGGSGADLAAFAVEATALIRESWEDNYFSALTLEIGSPIAIVDGEELQITPPAIQDGEPVLPLDEIADILGETPQNSGVQLFFAPTAENLGLEVHCDGSTIIVTKPYQMKQLVVKTRDGSALHNDFGAVQYVTNGRGLYLLLYATPEETAAAHAALENVPNVLYALPNKPISLAETEGATSTAVALSDPPNTLPSDMRWGSDRIAADLMKNYLVGEGLGSDLYVAVIDSGVDTNHEHLENRLADGFNLVDWGDPMTDELGHGTHVSGTIVDCTPFNVKIMPFKIFDGNGNLSSTFHVMMATLLAIDAGAEVINMSLTGACFDDNCLDKQAIESAVAAGITVVVAAGNETADTEYYCPAKLTNVVTVAATDEGDCAAIFSNYGAAVDISAPGVNIYSSYPTTADPWEWYDGENPYKSMPGTSMATPHVAAAAAMMKLEDGSRSPEEIKAALCASTVDLGAPGWDPHYGAGRLDLRIHMDENPVPLIDIAFAIDNYSRPYSSFNNSIYPSFTFTPIDATDKSYWMESDNPDVAYCDNDNNRIIIIGAGSAVITAYGADGVQAQCTLNISPSELWFDYPAASYAGGSGTQSSPYLIATPEQLAKLAVDTYYVEQGLMEVGSDSGTYFKFVADIDLAGKEWIPIRASAYYFGFSFDGGYHQVKNMTMYDDYSYVGAMGLFSAMYGGTIKNLAVVDAVIDYYSFFDTGILLGIEGFDSVVERCYTTGASSGAGFIGTVNANAVISNCFSTADAWGGGLVYRFGGGLIANSYASGYVGAIWGGHADTYADSAGLVRDMVPDGLETSIGPNIVSSFAANHPETEIGFVGSKTGGTVTKSYYLNINRLGIMDDDAYDGNIPVDVADLQAVDLDFFKDEESFTTAENWNAAYPWDFDCTWAIDTEINDGLPYLAGFDNPEPMPTTPPVISGGAAETPWENPFKDISENDWYYGDVEYVTENGLMNGTGDEEFSPEDYLTRGMLVTMLYRHAGEPGPQGGGGMFADVSKDKYYAYAVAWAAANGIVTGDGGYFFPEAEITREELVTMLYRYEQYMGGGFKGAWVFPLPYADREAISDWAYESVCWCTANGVVNGRPGNLFDSQGFATRAEAAAMLHRFLEMNR